MSDDTDPWIILRQIMGPIWDSLYYKALTDVFDGGSQYVEFKAQIEIIRGRRDTDHDLLIAMSDKFSIFDMRPTHLNQGRSPYMWRFELSEPGVIDKIRAKLKEVCDVKQE